MKTASIGWEGFPLSTLRETNLLLTLAHPNIIPVREMVLGATPDKVFMVMDFMDCDLRTYLTSLSSPLTAAQTKGLLQQMLTGVAAMHERWVMHRDLKSTNVLVDRTGRVCLCDFGLARLFGEPLRPYTDPKVIVTRWYRAPELLLQQPTYAASLDLWSVGLLFAELMTREPLLMGESEPDQLRRIFQLLGTPLDPDSDVDLPRAIALGLRRERVPGARARWVLPDSLSADEANLVWPGWRSLPAGKLVSTHVFPTGQLRDAIGLPRHSFTNQPYLSDEGLDLLRRMLCYDPARRITAREALAHPYFFEAPAPSPPERLPRPPIAAEAAGEATGAAPAT